MARYAANAKVKALGTQPERRTKCAVATMPTDSQLVDLVRTGDR